MRKFEPVITYSFSFVSTVPPLQPLFGHYVRNQSLESSSRRHRTNSYVKHSFLLFTWLRYLFKTNSGRRSRKFSCAFLPTREKAYALPRAPMAHKTNSHEHFAFKFYFFKFAFKARVLKCPQFKALSEQVLFTLILKSRYPRLETSLALLRSFTLTVPGGVPQFLTYSRTLLVADRTYL